MKPCSAIFGSRLSSHRLFTIRRWRSAHSRRRGAMLIMIAIMIVAFLVTVAFSVDIAYMHLVRSELRTATDSATKAAAQTLVRTSSRQRAIEAAQSIGREHLVGGQPLEISPNEIQFGNSTPNLRGSFSFVNGGTPNNSIRINGRRTVDSLGGAVPLYFGRLFNVNSFQPQQFSTATFVERDIVLVVDRSGSMLGYNWNSLLRAVRVFVDVLRSSNSVEEQVALASYSSDASEDQGLTINLNLINEAIDRLRPDGATSISRGMDAGFRLMQRGRPGEFVERTMIVMTDGIHNLGRDPILSAQEVAGNNVVIHTITFGPVIDRARMQRIAQIGRGRYFHADDSGDLSDAFREIALTLNTIMTE